jgi:hypothetical protein
MRILVCKRHCRYVALLAGWVAAPVLLVGQPTSGIVHQARYVCMWNEPVCQAGSHVSIGIVATDADMSVLDGLHGVRELGFIVGGNRRGAAKIGDAGFMHVQSLHGLEVLDAIDLPRLDDGALRSLSKLYWLREARFEGNRNFDDAGLAYLGHLTALQTLTFYGAPITDRGIRYLSDAVGLQDLQLGDSLVTDEGAKEIATQFRHLKMLDLQETKITNTGMAYISTLPDLQWLGLTNTAVTDQGLLELRSVSTLRDLYLTSGTVHSESITLLQHALPGLKIHIIYRNGLEMPNAQGQKPVKFEIPTKLNVDRTSPADHGLALSLAVDTAVTQPTEDEIPVQRLLNLCLVHDSFPACEPLVLTIDNHGTQAIRSGQRTCSPPPLYFELKEEDGTWRELRAKVTVWVCSHNSIQWATIQPNAKYTIRAYISAYALGMITLAGEGPFTVRARWNVYGCPAAAHLHTDDAAAPSGTGVSLWESQCMGGIAPEEPYARLISNPVTLKAAGGPLPENGDGELGLNYRRTSRFTAHSAR